MHQMLADGTPTSSHITPPISNLQTLYIERQPQSTHCCSDLHPKPCTIHHSTPSISNPPRSSSDTDPRRDTHARHRSIPHNASFCQKASVARLTTASKLVTGAWLARTTLWCEAQSYLSGCLRYRASQAPVDVSSLGCGRFCGLTSLSGRRYWRGCEMVRW